MSLSTPTINEVAANIKAQLAASIQQLPKAFLDVLSKVLAGVFILLYKYGGFIFLQIFIKTASDVDTEINGKIVNPLIEWGRLIGVGDPVAATHAELSINVVVENETVGDILPSASQLVNANNGVTYLTIGAVALDDPTVSVLIRAASDQAGGNGAGTIGNLEPGDIVSFANPLPNVNRDATVVSQEVTGADREATEAYRQRILDRFQKRPQGGAYADYELWGEEVAGIANIYPYTSINPGQVDIYAESSTEADGIPTAAQLQAVFDAIDSQRPANAFINVFSITRTSFDITVAGLIVDNEAQVKTDIEAGLVEYFLSKEPFIAGLSILPRRDRIVDSEVVAVIQDIVNAAGGIFDGAVIRTTIGQDLISLYSLSEGEKAKAENVSFI